MTLRERARRAGINEFTVAIPFGWMLIFDFMVDLDVIIRRPDPFWPTVRGLLTVFFSGIVLASFGCRRLPLIVFMGIGTVIVSKAWVNIWMSSKAFAPEWETQAAAVLGWTMTCLASMAVGVLLAPTIVSTERRNDKRQDRGGPADSSWRYSRFRR